MKKVLALLLSFCMIFTLVGCTANQKDLVKAMQATNSWEAYEMDLNGDITVMAMGEQIKIGLSSTGYMNMKEMKGNVSLEMKEASGMMNLPQMDMYIDGGNTYINKSYFTDTYTSSGLPMPRKLRHLEADYICIGGEDDFTTQMLAMVAQTDYVQKVFDLYEALFTVTKIDIPVEKSGDTYTVNITSEQMVEMVKGIMANLPEAMALINEKLGLDLGTQEIMSLVQDQDMASILPVIKQVLEGSSMTLTYTLKDDTFTQEIKMSVGTVEGIGLTMNMKSSGKKVEAREVEIPTNVVTLNMEEYTQLLTPQMIQMNIKTGEAYTAMGESLNIKAITQNGEVFVPAKQALGSLGYKVVFDTQTQKVSFVDGEKSVAMNVMIVNSTSYISLEELVTLGFSTIVNEDILILMD